MASSFASIIDEEGKEFTEKLENENKKKTLYEVYQSGQTEKSSKISCEKNWKSLYLMIQVEVSNFFSIYV